jgi:hypothetical protein
VKFFFDNNLLDVEATHLRDRFAPDTKDVDWIPVVGSEGWVVVTGDDHLRTRAAEYRALQQNMVTTLFLPRKFLDRGLWKQAEYVIRYWPSIQVALQELRSGSQVRATEHGKLDRMK